jgi:hypothetical protein
VDLRSLLGQEAQFPNGGSLDLELGLRQLSEFSKRNAVGSSYLVKPKKRFDDTGTLSISDYDFIRGWVLWCRAMAAGLTAMSGSTWTARDVEMAVYRAADSRRPPIKLRPIRQ